MSKGSSGSVSYTKPNSQVLFEDIFQNLSHQNPAAFKKKYAALYSESYQKMHQAGEWVEMRMQQQICGELGIDFTFYRDAFLTGDREAYLTLRPVLLRHLGFPDGEIPGKLDKCERSSLSPDRAAQWLNSALIDQLCAKGSISPITWYRFKTGKVAPKTKTLTVLRDLLKLSPSEEMELKQLVRKDIIDDLTRISPEVRRQWSLWQQKKADLLSGEDELTRLEDFWAYTAVSPKAMHAFGIPRITANQNAPAGKTAPSNSSQGTLLKLTIGFELTERTGTDFMALACSGFFDMRDTLFLTCLYLRLYDIETINRILEFYAKNPEAPAAPRLENPYKERRPMAKK